jgi:hypothetical protein
LPAAPAVTGESLPKDGYVSPDYQLRVCLCGSYDVGAGNSSAGCYKCGKSINAISTPEAISKWNELNSPAQHDVKRLIEALKDYHFALYGHGTGRPDVDALISEIEGRK